MVKEKRMEKRKLEVLLVDDEFCCNPSSGRFTPEQIELNELINQLEATDLVSVTPYDHYDALGLTPEAVLETVRRYDLLILDVYMLEGKDRGPFMRTLNTIGRIRPFFGIHCNAAWRGSGRTIGCVAARSGVSNGRFGDYHQTQVGSEIRERHGILRNCKAGPMVLLVYLWVRGQTRVPTVGPIAWFCIRASIH